jgi:hypothetical protein
MDFTNTYRKPLENDYYKSLLDCMPEMVSITAIIYNEKNKPIDFYAKDLKLPFAKLFNKTKQELLNKKRTSVIAVGEDLLESLLKKKYGYFGYRFQRRNFTPKAQTIFTPFTRKKNIELIQETKLGLSIAKEAAAAMKTKIIVKSTFYKETSFIVKTPKIGYDV